MIRCFIITHLFLLLLNSEYLLYLSGDQNSCILMWNQNRNIVCIHWDYVPPNKMCLVHTQNTGVLVHFPKINIDVEIYQSHKTKMYKKYNIPETV